jgi:hypothetical protein
MATISKSSKKANPMKTRNERVRLGNYSTAALQELAEKAASKKQKHKIENRIKYNVKRGV